MIQTGIVRYGYTTETDWNLHTGTGERSFRTPDISFEKPFTAPPRVVLALGGLDSEHTTNLRVHLDPYDIEASEFSVKIQTWADTRLYEVSIMWVAYD